MPMSLPARTTLEVPTYPPHRSNFFCSWFRGKILAFAFLFTFVAGGLVPSTTAQIITPDSASVPSVNSANPAEPLASWKIGPAKKAILDFVGRVCDADSGDFVQPSDRIAVFDNDGCLWCENPLPFQVAFAIDELKRRVPEEPELAADTMVQAAIAGDLAKLLTGENHDGLMRVLALTHTEMTNVEFESRVNEWVESAMHPRFQRKYSELTYQPMQEVLDYLHDHDFKCFIVSGGGADFMRAWSERVYGIPAERVVGTSTQPRYEMRDGKPTLIKTSASFFNDDKEGKPVGIHQHIGRRPIACFGNSDGDQAMLEYTTIDNPRPSFGLIVHHTDGDREYAYDANPSSSGKLTTALTDAPKRGWVVVDMKEDWTTVFKTDSPSETPKAPVTSEIPEQLVGSWLAEDIDNRGVVDRAQSTLEFTADGKVGGNTSVNRFFGSVTFEGNQLTMGGLGMTRRAGPPALMDQESRFVAALGKAVTYRVADTGLMFLSDANGKDVLRFSKMNDQK